MFRKPTDERGAIAWEKGHAFGERLLAWGDDMLRRAFGPKADRVNWRGPNWWTIAAVGIALALTRIPPHQHMFGRDLGPNIAALVGWFGAIMIRRIVASYGKAIDEFEPATALQAKRANEQIKLVATLVNSAAGAAVTVFALSELVKGNDTNYVQIIFATGLALWIHTAARSLLGKLKNEALAN